MSIHPRRYVLGCVVNGAIAGWYDDGSPASFPLSRRECLVVSRSDCDLLCLRLPRLSPRRLRERVASALPGSFPGRLSGYVYDCVVRTVGRECVVLVALVRRDVLALYATAAGGAPLTLLSLLVVATLRQRAQRPLPAHRLKPVADDTGDTAYLVEWGATNELLNLRGDNLDSSVLLLPRLASQKTGTASVPPRVTLTPCIDATPTGPAAPVRLPPRLRADHRLFEEDRGVRRWTRCELLSPLFLSLALPLLFSADLAALSLLSRFTVEARRLHAEVDRAGPERPPAPRAVAPDAASSAGARSPRAGGTRPAGAAGAASPYTILSQLLDVVEGDATVRVFSLSRGAATIEFLARNPIAILQLVESTEAVASAELLSAGAPLADGRIPTTLKAVCR